MVADTPAGNLLLLGPIARAPALGRGRANRRPTDVGERAWE